MIPQSEDATKALDYRNMLAVCSGARNSVGNDNKTCDARRGNRKLSLNPLVSESIAGIKYRNSGYIYSDDNLVDEELNDILNLNCRVRDLPQARKKALTGMIMGLKKKGMDGDREFYKRLLENFKTETNQKTEFVGILIWWLEKKIL